MDAVSGATADRRRMRRALALARRGWGFTAPNPLVGAVVVAGDDIVGEGWHHRYGEAHAEVHALRAAGERARGGTLYVTLEPCAHHGNTPPCADAVIAAGVARVVVAAPDPNPVAAGGIARLRAAGVQVDVGVLEAEARELNAPFHFAQTGAGRPWVTLKLAVSLDGALGDATGKPGWLTNRRSRRAVHRLRAGADAIAVGSGTAIADDPALTVRDGVGVRVPPLRVVFDRRLRLPATSQLARTARDVPVLVLAGEPTANAAAEADSAAASALRAAGVEIAVSGDVPAALRHLAARGVRHLFVEGGATLAGALLRAAVVDRLIIFQAPLILGAGARGAFAEAPSAAIADAHRWTVVERHSLGSDLMTVYAPEAR